MKEELAADLQLGGRLGSGAMGSVWQAVDLTTGESVAVKTILHEQINNPGLRKRFEREAQVCLRLKNPHAVHTSRYGISPAGTPYLVMELLGGTDLTHLIEIKGPLELPRCEQLVEQICSVLEEAHGLGVVHRDIKPDNIFLTETEPNLFVKVLDFGIAKLFEHSAVGTLVTGTGMVIGTPGFMSPEQTFSSKNVDFRSDLYSLALVTYYALTGHVAFEEADDKLPPWMHDLTPASTLVDGLSPAIDAWFTKALARQPQDRFASAREQATAFREAVRLVEGGTHAMQRADLEAALAQEQNAEVTDFAATVVRGSAEAQATAAANAREPLPSHAPGPHGQSTSNSPRVVPPFSIPPQSIPDRVPRRQTGSHPHGETGVPAPRQLVPPSSHSAAQTLPRRQVSSYGPEDLDPRRQAPSGAPREQGQAAPQPVRPPLSSTPAVPVSGMFENPYARAQGPSSLANNPVYQPVKRHGWLPAAIVIALLVTLLIALVLIGVL